MVITDKGIARGTDRIAFRFHPRVFAALGADLVTNDVVAVIELVKNSYDAFAENIWIRFREDLEGRYIEIEDDGIGMTRDIIENVWCIVATPHKATNTYVQSGMKQRRVTGEKGLGRLSAARLGKRLEMQTKSENDICWNVRVDWDAVSSDNESGESYAECTAYPHESLFKKSGTRIRVYDLNSTWNEQYISDLRENLSRLVSPFSEHDDLNISLSTFDDANTHQNGIEIQAPEFLSKPKYAIKGSVDHYGNINAEYRFAPIVDDVAREKSFTRTWQDIYHRIERSVNRGINKDIARFTYSVESAHCGSFDFEIRAWDIAPEDTLEISQRFNFQKSHIRKAIATHKGISVYRDGILVLPKSDKSRDWLELDPRRIGRVGPNLSTSQVVGYVSISAENNPRIKDTSDREGLASSLEVAEFSEILKYIIGILEIERDVDRVRHSPEKPLKSLFDQLSAENVISEVRDMSERGAVARDVLPVLHTFNTSLEETRDEIQERFVYYSRLATVGTIAHMLVHEIRGRTTAFGRLLRVIKTKYAPFEDQDLKRAYELADRSVDALERLADTFSPLASRGFRRRKRTSILEGRIRDCLVLHEGEAKAMAVQCQVPNSKTEVAVDPGELDAIILNLVSNALYWMRDVTRTDHELSFRIQSISHVNRVRIYVDDTGPGIDEDDLERIFWPGVTRKPGGIGMGLTVASELVSEYDGRMGIDKNKVNGASFVFDLPLAK